MRTGPLVAGQLIQIAPELDRAIPGIQLLIAGGGNVFDKLKARAEEVNRTLGRPCVTMTGPRTDINEIVAAGDLFVGVSRAALEAMAAGKPVIVAGNEGYQGLFGPDKLAEAREGNFCCRGLPLSQPDQLCRDVVAALRPVPRGAGAGGGLWPAGDLRLLLGPPDGRRLSGHVRPGAPEKVPGGHERLLRL